METVFGESFIMRIRLDKKPHILIILVMTVLFFCASFSSKVTTEAASEKVTTEVASEEVTTEKTHVKIEKPGIRIRIGDEKKVTKRYKGSFRKKKGEIYFRCRNKADRQSFGGGFFTVGKYVYHSGKKGRLDRGWKKLGGQYYYFDRETGRLAINKTVDLVKIDKYGTPKNLKKDKARIKTCIKARKVVESVTNPTDSRSTKLYKCYKWMEALHYKQYRRFMTGYKEHPDDWDVVFANDIFDTNLGCCVSEAAAFAFIARECGYKDIYICSDSGHAWTLIEGRLYDPLFAEAKNFSQFYDAPNFRGTPSYKKKI